MKTSQLLDPGDVHRRVAELSARDAWSRAALVDVQQQRLAGLLAHAVSASPYYHDAMGDAVRAGASLDDLPILTKTTLMNEWDRIVTDPRLRLRDLEAHLAGDRRGELLLGEYRPFATGGTTGERAVVVYGPADWLETIANLVRWIHTMGARPDARVVGIGAPTALHISNRAFAELGSGRTAAPRLSVLTPVSELVGQLNDYQPEIIFTYASFARRLVEEQDAGRLRIHPRRIASTAEALSADVRRLVRDTWDARVVDSYGTTEGGLLGSECDAGQGIHIAEDMLVFEVVDDHNRRVPDGTQGSKVLMTCLFNRTLPLIRYEISDLVTLERSACPCGRPYARVTSIEGRREDYMVLRAAAGGSIRLHASRLRAPLAGVPGLRQYQVAPREGQLTLKLAVRNPADAESARTRATDIIRSVLCAAGADVSVSTEIVDTIERVGTAAKEKLLAI
ncbi:MAG TPA: AMP-binding protein [Vicinamibacterales bacterium]|jgi:phenylacetate-coenzyme A ligase PaaK-like adenylate-forming protein